MSEYQLTSRSTTSGIASYLAAGGDINATNSFGMRPIEVAAQAGDLDEFNAILTTPGFDPRNTRVGLFLDVLRQTGGPDAQARADALAPAVANLLAYREQVEADPSIIARNAQSVYGQAGVLQAFEGANLADELVAGLAGQPATRVDDRLRAAQQEMSGNGQGVDGVGQPTEPEAVSQDQSSDSPVLDENGQPKVFTHGNVEPVFDGRPLDLPEAGAPIPPYIDVSAIGQNAGLSDGDERKPIAPEELHSWVMSSATRRQNYEQSRDNAIQLAMDGLRSRDPSAPWDMDQLKRDRRRLESEIAHWSGEVKRHDEAITADPKSGGSTVDRWESLDNLDRAYAGLRDAKAALIVNIASQERARKAQLAMETPSVVEPAPTAQAQAQAQVQAEAPKVTEPDRGLMSRLITGAGDIFDKFASRVASLDYKTAIGVPMLASAALLASGLGMEVHGQSELLEQGLTHLNAYKDMLASGMPSTTLETIKEGLKGNLPSMGGNEMMQGLVAGYVTPVIGAASVALARGYAHLKGWMSDQHSDPSAAYDAIMAERNAQQPAREMS